MGLFDRAREQREQAARTAREQREQAAQNARRNQQSAEAAERLHELHLRQVSARGRLGEWQSAVRMLGDIYTRERAANTVASEQRIKYLQVAEPRPVLEDFAPEYLSWLDSDPIVLLTDVQDRFNKDQLEHPKREQARLAELEFARNALEQQRVRQRGAAASAELERHQARLRLWSRYTTLDSDIAALPSLERQVQAQNAKIENQVDALSNLLTSGLTIVPLPIAPDVSQNAKPGIHPSDVILSTEDDLRSIELGVDFAQQYRVAYSPESRQIVIEYELPDVSVVPKAKNYRYIKSRNEITETTRPQSQVKALYVNAIAQIALLCLATTLAKDRHSAIDVVVFNGMVDTLDPRSGQRIHPCLITVRVTRGKFAELNLEHVDPQSCLKHLSASVSRSPTELAPVKPILEFSMVDPRFVDATDVVSLLDDRPNLLELSPTEFEVLIQNLFTSMGLEARQTRASRDGGVDCIAYDTRPIFGGKVVIQAKRYKNTVGVSAVRDLFGTLQNEGASKGILVTTSGYGPASFEFARNKPIELIEGANLLYLLEEHAGVKARIEPPEDWNDPVPDSGELPSPPQQHTTGVESTEGG
jgi:HJR/Mrr/RecB family endonuclease